MPTFRKKPVVINAARLTHRREIPTLEGVMIANKGDWLITGVEGEQYPCKDAIFRKTYEPVGPHARLMWEQSDGFYNEHKGV